MQTPHLDKVDARNDVDKIEQDHEREARGGSHEDEDDESEGDAKMEDTRPRGYRPRFHPPRVELSILQYRSWLLRHLLFRAMMTLPVTMAHILTPCGCLHRQRRRIRGGRANPVCPSPPINLTSATGTNSRCSPTPTLEDDMQWLASTPPFWSGLNPTAKPRPRNLPSPPRYYQLFLATNISPLQLPPLLPSLCVTSPSPLPPRHQLSGSRELVERVIKLLAGVTSSET